MKKLALIIALLFPTLNFGICTEKIPHNTYASIDGIRDGWYSATVVYFNYNTYTRSTYTLDIKVEDDQVVVIDFGNGGTVHTGYNQSGYTYSGGDLFFERDYNDNITEAITKVTIYYDNGNIVTFDITIE